MTRGSFGSEKITRRKMSDPSKKRKLEEVVPEESKEEETLILCAPVHVKKESVVELFSTFVSCAQDVFGWNEMLKVYKEEAEDKRSKRCRSWCTNLISKWKWEKTTRVHARPFINALIDSHHKMVIQKGEQPIEEEKLVLTIWTNCNTLIEFGRIKVVDDIWNGGGIPIHISNPKWPSSSMQLVDGNLTEVLCFYVAHRGRYGNTMSLPVLAWIFAHYYGETGVKWFLYITLVCMAIELPSRHEPWDEGDVTFSFEVALDHLCAFDAFKKHSQIEKLSKSL